MVNYRRTTVHEWPYPRLFIINRHSTTKCQSFFLFFFFFFMIINIKFIIKVFKKRKGLNKAKYLGEHISETKKIYNFLHECLCGAVRVVTLQLFASDETTRYFYGKSFTESRTPSSHLSSGLHERVIGGRNTLSM